MGFQTRPAPWLLSDRDRNLAREKMNETALHAKALSASLPSNRELLTKVRRYGLQKV
jgi:tryptophan halogenase